MTELSEARKQQLGPIEARGAPWAGLSAKAIIRVGSSYEARSRTMGNPQKRWFWQWKVLVLKGIGGDSHIQ